MHLAKDAQPRERVPETSEPGEPQTRKKKKDTDITTYGMVQMDNQHPSGMVSSTGLESHLHLVTIKRRETCFGTGAELEARKPNQMNIAENDVKR